MEVFLDVPSCLAFLLGNMDVLVLSRKIGERILIGDRITITVVKVAQGGVRIGVEAPREMAIVREELAIQLEEAEQRAIKVQAE